MYRISLYPEYHQKKRRAKLRLVRTTLLIGLLGLEFTLVGSLVMSAALLREQTSDYREGVARLAAFAQEAGQPDPLLETARQILNVRSSRIDWSPKLTALAAGISPSLQLDRVAGQCAAPKQSAQLEMTGGMRGGDVRLEDVSSFMEVLRSDSRITWDFPHIELGTLKGGSASNFRLLCVPQEDDS